MFILITFLACEHSVLHGERYEGSSRNIRHTNGDTATTRGRRRVEILSDNKTSPLTTKMATCTKNNLSSNTIVQNEMQFGDGKHCSKRMVGNKLDMPKYKNKLCQKDDNNETTSESKPYRHCKKSAKTKKDKRRGNIRRAHFV